MTYAWDTASVARLNELWGLGWSCGVIADDMGGGLTRNAVIGKITRLGLTRSIATTRTNRVRGVGSKGGRGLHRPPPKSLKRWPRKSQTDRLGTTRPRQVRAEPLRARSNAEPASRDLSILELTGRTCKWPYGDRSPYSFCGHGTEPGSPYCPWHTAKAFNGIPERTRRIGRTG